MPVPDVVFIAGLLNKGDTAKTATETGGVTADAKAAQTAAEGLSGADAELADEQVKNQEKADASPKDIFALIGDAMDAIMAGAAALGAKIAEAIIGFFTLDDYAMGDKVGWLAGTILFEVALAYFTGGTYAALIESKPFLKYLVKLLDLGGEIIGAIGKLLKSIKVPLMAGVKSFGKLAGKIPILNTIIEKIAAALKAVFKFFDSKAGREAVEGTAEKLGKETAEEAAEKTAKNVTEEGVEKATKETAEEAAEKGKKLDDLETGKKPTPDELAEKPAALAEAKGMAEINDALDLPVAVTIAALSSLKARYKWIKSFEARPKPIPGHYEIHMIASDGVVDKDYSEEVAVPKAWDSPDLTVDEFIASYKQKYPKTSLSDKELAEDFLEGRRLNPDTGRLKTPGAGQEKMRLPEGTTKEEFLEGLLAKDSSSSLKPYVEMLQENGIIKSVDDIKKIMPEPGGKYTDTVRHQIKEAYKEQILEKMTRNLSPEESYQMLRKMTDGLNSSDKGNLTEMWYKTFVVLTNKVYGGEGAVHKKVLKDDFKHIDGLKGDRVPDLLEGNTLGEIKSGAGELGQHDLDQFEDYMKLTQNKKPPLYKNPDTGVAVTNVKYRFTDANGAKANKKWILENYNKYPNLEFEIVDVGGKRHVFGQGKLKELRKFLEGL